MATSGTSGGETDARAEGGAVGAPAVAARRLLHGAALVAVLAGLAIAGGSAETVRPNVLLISIDSLRADHLHTYGYARETSPVIDRIAREGVRFEAAISPSSWTLPAHVTLLTGTPPELHGLTDPRRRLDASTRTLAEVLRENGYATAAFVSGPFLRSLYGYGRGFEVWDDVLAQKSKQDAHRGVTSPALVQRVDAWLDEWGAAGPRRPFFLFVHMWDVHYDYDPPPPYDTMFDPDYAGDVDGTDFETGARVHRRMEPRDLEHVIALYDGEIRFTDAWVGKLLSRLQRLGVLDDTIVVVTSDHGDEFFEHGNKGHAKALYDETVRVPLVLRHPRRVPAGRVVEEQVRLADVAPTILGLAGVPAPKDFGTAADTAHREQDLSAWLVGERSDFPELLAFGETSRAGPPKRFARSRGEKYIEQARGRPRPELYDLDGDPGETKDLAVGPQPPPSRLREAAEAWKRQWSRVESRGRPVELDPELEQQLRALGYLK